MRRSLSARRAWIEIDAIAVQAANSSVSLSARRAWIEMGWRLTACLMMYVALRKESVDRNVNLRVLDGSKSVALRKESVDRNFGRDAAKSRKTLRSLSARRAWIEMGVLFLSSVLLLSLSARRAWIEISD